jgi:hypothetical protein
VAATLTGQLLMALLAILLALLFGLWLLPFPGFGG